MEKGRPEGLPSMRRANRRRSVLAKLLALEGRISVAARTRRGAPAAFAAALGAVGPVAAAMAHDSLHSYRPVFLGFAAIALLTVSVNFVVDWFLHKTSGLRDV